jgi:hypothetical protein
MSMAEAELFDDFLTISEISEIRGVFIFLTLLPFAPGCLACSNFLGKNQ